MYQSPAVLSCDDFGGLGDAPIGYLEDECSLQPSKQNSNIILITTTLNWAGLS